MAQPSELPGATVDAVLAGCATRVTCLRYADRVFLSVAQRAAFGTLVAAATSEHPDGTREPSVRVLLGDREDPLVHLVATRLQEAVFRDCRLPLLLGLGMAAPLTEESTRELLAYLEAARPWAPQQPGAPPR